MNKKLISFRVMKDDPEYNEKTLEVLSFMQSLDNNGAEYECDMAWRPHDDGNQAEDIYLITLSQDGYAIYQLIKD